ncbi:MAG: hypothetical protein ACOX3G_03650 [Armatimonadota bacterium]|jgi:hypothetical protein
MDKTRKCERGERRRGGDSEIATHRDITCSKGEHLTSDIENVVAVSLSRPDPASRERLSETEIGHYIIVAGFETCDMTVRRSTPVVG